MAVESNRGITLVPTTQPSESRHHPRIDGKVSRRSLRTEGRPWSRRISRPQRQHADPRLRAARRASRTQIADDEVIRQCGGARRVQRRRRGPRPGKLACRPARSARTHSAGAGRLRSPACGCRTHPSRVTNGGGAFQRSHLGQSRAAAGEFGPAATALPLLRCGRARIAFRRDAGASGPSHGRRRGLGACLLPQPHGRRLGAPSMAGAHRRLPTKDSARIWLQTSPPSARLPRRCPRFSLRRLIQRTWGCTGSGLAP